MEEREQEIKKMNRIFIWYLQREDFWNTEWEGKSAPWLLLHLNKTSGLSMKPKLAC